MASLIITTGKYSLDIYSQELGKRLRVSKIETKIPTSFREGYKFIKLLRGNKQDTIHLPNQNLARYGFFLKIPYIATVHDLTLQFSSLYQLNYRRKIYIELDKFGLKRAKHIIAVSENTKKDVIENLKIPEEGISVIYQGVDHDLFYPHNDELFDFKYILFVGSEQPRKNFITLLKAFSKVTKEEPFKDLKLLKVGEAGTEEDRRASLKAIKKLSLNNSVIFTDFFPERELPKLYSNAECFVLPSLYEGFGLPVIEAMACGCPVITSNVSSLPEIVVDAGIMLDPHDIDSLTKSIKELLTNGELKEGMIRKGLKRAKMFSWDKTAEETIKVYEMLECKR